jgi:hypothetical protein
LLGKITENLHRNIAYREVANKEGAFRENAPQCSAFAFFFFLGGGGTTDPRNLRENGIFSF